MKTEDPKLPTDQDSHLCDVLVSINGTVSTKVEAQLPIDDRGYFFGHGVFATILVANKVRVFWLDHLEKLRNSCIELFIAPPDFQLLEQWSQQLIDEFCKHNPSNLHTKSVLKIVISAKDSHNLFRVSSDFYESNIVLQIKLASETSFKPLRLGTALDPRAVGISHLKHLSYLPIFLSFLRLRKQFDDQLFVSAGGEIVESSTANFFMFSRSKNVLYTSNLGYQGVSLKNFLLEYEKLKGVRVHFNIPKTWDFTGCFCFLISSIRGVVPVLSIDDVYCLYDINFAKKVESYWQMMLCGKTTSTSLEQALCPDFENSGSTMLE